MHSCKNVSGLPLKGGTDADNIMTKYSSGQLTPWLCNEPRLELMWYFATPAIRCLQGPPPITPSQEAAAGGKSTPVCV